MLIVGNELRSDCASETLSVHNDLGFGGFLSLEDIVKTGLGINHETPFVWSACR